MAVVDTIYKVIDEKCLKQSAVARAAGYEPKVFNAMLRGRGRVQKKISFSWFSSACALNRIMVQ